MRLGTWFAVTYAAPRQPAPTLCENTRVRTSPTSRDRIVRPAMSAAPRAMPAAGRSARSGPADPGRPASALVCVVMFSPAKRLRPPQQAISWPGVEAGNRQRAGVQQGPAESRETPLTIAPTPHRWPIKAPQSPYQRLWHKRDAQLSQLVHVLWLRCWRSGTHQAWGARRASRCAAGGAL